MIEIRHGECCLVVGNIAINLEKTFEKISERHGGNDETKRQVFFSLLKGVGNPGRAVADERLANLIRTYTVTEE